MIKPMSDTSWKKLLTDREIVQRGLRFALIVGLILIVINHGDALIRGDVSGDRLARILLTMAVPYCVSVLSSVGAIRRHRQEEPDC